MRKLGERSQFLSQSSNLQLSQGSLSKCWKRAWFCCFSSPTPPPSKAAATSRLMVHIWLLRHKLSPHKLQHSVQRYFTQYCFPKYLTTRHTCIPFCKCLRTGLWSGPLVLKSLRLDKNVVFFPLHKLGIAYYICINLGGTKSAPRYPE